MRLITVISIIFQLFMQTAHAGVMAAATRIIYHAKAHEKSVMLANTNPYPVIVQNWVDEGAGEPESAAAPFISLPPVLRLAPGEKQGLRIIYNQAPLPQDRESVFWLNLYEIPPEKIENEKEAVSRLRLVMNTQLKIFFRPAGLSLTPEEAVSKLAFHLLHKEDGWFIECENPTPLHISFTSLSLLNGKQAQAVQQEPDMMTAPYSKRRYRLSASTAPITHNNLVRFYYLNDNGALLMQDVAL